MTDFIGLLGTIFVGLVVAINTRALRVIVEEENKKKPLTDERLTKILQEKGYKIARRTVAKYRDQLKILPVKHRRHAKHST